MRPLMQVTYTKLRGAPAIHRWPGGLVATTLTWTSGIPHDVGHWFLDAQVDLPWGFWSLAGQRAPFDSFTLVSGKWPRDRYEFLDRVRRKHRAAMLHAEGHSGAWLADPNLDLHGDWHRIRRGLAKAYAIADNPLADLTLQDVERLRPFALRNAAIWDALPEGGSVELTWPGLNDLTVVSTETRGFGSLPEELRTLARTPRVTANAGKRRHHKHQRTFDLVPEG